MGYMQTVFEAAGGNEGLRRLAYAWHKRVMADDVVAHAFSHGFHLHSCRATSRLLGQGTMWPDYVFQFLW